MFLALYLIKLVFYRIPSLARNVLELRLIWQAALPTPCLHNQQTLNKINLVKNNQELINYLKNKFLLSQTMIWTDQVSSWYR